jgi:hypothetical protein
MRYFVDGTPTVANPGRLVLPNGNVVLGWNGETGTFQGFAVTAEPDPLPDPAIPVVTPWRARLALNAAGQRAAIEAWIATQPQDVKDGWEYATEVRRDHPMIAAAIAAGVMTETQVDELFALAATL